MTSTARPTALVTGSTSGLGRVFSEHLARDHDLVLVARDEGRLAEAAARLARTYGARAQVISADLATDGGVARVVEWIATNRVDVLVNNAGMASGGSLAKASVVSQQTMIQVHVLAVYRLTTAVLPQMLERRSGAIINVASVASFMASPGNANYTATKSYVRVLTESLDEEIAGRGVYVQALCPGFMHTELHDRASLSKSKIPGWMWMDPHRVVATSLGAFRRRAPCVVIPGLRYRLLVAILRHAPRTLLTWILRLHRRA
jgi:short-subunit dehydrogenase